MVNKKIWLTVIISGLLSTNASAENSDALSIGQGWNVSGSLGHADIKGKNIFSTDSVTNNAFSGSASVGYDFNKTLGLFVAYQHINAIGNNQKQDVGIIGTQLNYYVTDNVSSFFKVGAAYHQQWTGMGGVGLEYHATPSISTYIGYDYFQNLYINNNDVALNNVYWGMKYKFGQQKEVQTKIIERVNMINIDVPVLTRTNYIVTFDTSQSTLTPLSISTLNDINAALKQFPDLKLKITGRTDRTGNDVINEHLSFIRAVSVADYLINSSTMNKQRIQINSVADKSPLSTSSPIKSQLERSVQIQLIQG